MSSYREDAEDITIEELRDLCKRLRKSWDEDREEHVVIQEKLLDQLRRVHQSFHELWRRTEGRFL